jgi:uncharacterized protein (TIGR00369 family)
MTDLLASARSFIETIPHARALGMVLAELGDGRATITMPFAEKLIGDPVSRVVHGGAVSALMDTAGGAAVMCHPSAPTWTATLDLRIDYMRAATPGQTITARAECYHVARFFAFVRVIASDEDETRPVAAGTGPFTIETSAGWHR